MQQSCVRRKLAYQCSDNNALVNFIPHPPPTPGEGGGFDKLWGQPSCQIPTMSPGPSRGIWQHILAKYCAIATSNSSECAPMPLSATAMKIGKFSATAPGVGTSVNVKSPPEVWGRPGVGGGAWNWQVHNYWGVRQLFFPAKRYIYAN